MITRRRLYPLIQASQRASRKLHTSSQRNSSHPLRNLIVTTENVFSEANRLRCQGKLTEIKPVRSLSWAKGKNLKQAAVLVPLCHVDGVPSILFTLRASHLNSHRGEVSFPGGKEDDDDDHITETALREAEEEVGLDRNLVQVWGALSPVPTRNFESAVIPIVATCGNLDISSLKINHDEVSEAFTRTIPSLCDPQNTRYTHFRSSPNPYTLPVFLGGPHRIWGLSAIILHQCLSIIAPGLYKFRFRQIPR